MLPWERSRPSAVYIVYCWHWRRMQVRRVSGAFRLPCRLADLWASRTIAEASRIKRVDALCNFHAPRPRRGNEQPRRGSLVSAHIYTLSFSYLNLLPILGFFSIVSSLSQSFLSFFHLLASSTSVSTFPWLFHYIFSLPYYLLLANQYPLNWAHAASFFFTL